MKKFLFTVAGDKIPVEVISEYSEIMETTSFFGGNGPEKTEVKLSRIRLMAPVEGLYGDFVWEWCGHVGGTVPAGGELVVKNYQLSS